MRRTVFAVVLTLLTFDVSGLAALCGETSCEEACPTDGPDGQCPPNCSYCSCCSLPKVAGSLVVTLAEPRESEASWPGRAADHLPSPEPAEILHVPRSPLA